MTRPQAVESRSYVQRERLAYIDFRLYFFDEIGRPNLVDRFGVAPAGATRDLALYRKIASQSITFDGRNNIYRIEKAFSPLFEHASQRVPSALALGFGDGVNDATQPLLPCESPTALSSPKMDVLASVCRAIYAKRPVAIRYHTMSSGESERVIVPFALVDTGLRWHVRAFDRKSGEIRDFVVTRIEAPPLLDEEPQANDVRTTTSSGRASSSWTSCRTRALNASRSSRGTTGWPTARSGCACAQRWLATCCCAGAWTNRPTTGSKTNSTVSG